MERILKGSVIAFFAITLAITAMLSTAMPLSLIFEKAPYGVNSSEQSNMATIEQAVHRTIAYAEQVGDGYIIASSESLGTVCIMADYAANAKLKKGSAFEVHFNRVTANASTPYIYAKKIVIL